MTEPLFFKQTNNTNGAAEFKSCLPVNVNTSFVTLAPAIATAEQQLVKPFFGAALFSEAATYYGEYGTSGGSEVMNNFIKLLQMAVVRLAYWDSFDQLAVMMGDRGISDTNGENRAYRYQADALRASLRRQGFAFINEAIALCEENIDAGLANFSESEFYTRRQNSLIHSMKEFNEIVSIGNDFCLFARLRSYINQTEEMELPYRIGPTLAEDVREDRDDTTYDQIRSALMSFVVYWTMAEAVPVLNMVPTAEGMMVSTEGNTSSNSGKTATTPTQQQLQQLSDGYRQKAERSIGYAVTYMKKHIDVFTSITEIGVETAREKTAGFRKNKGKKSFVV